MARTKTITKEKVINRDIDWLFEFTQNFTERTKWDLQTIEIGFMNGYDRLEKGAKVYTKSIEGIRMDTEYITFEFPSEISIRMLNKSSIFKFFIGAWDYSKTEDKSKTRLKITYQFNLKFPYTLIQKRVSKKIENNISKKLNLLHVYLEQMNQDK